MRVTKYIHLFRKVNYPAERGYRMEPESLPDWIYFTISENNSSKYLTVYSRRHVNKEFTLPTSYNNAFTDYEMIKSLSEEIRNLFL